MQTRDSESRGNLIIRRLQEADKFLSTALEEFERGSKLNRDNILRDAAEKAWNAMVQVTEALLLAYGYSEDSIKTYRDKRLKLEELQFKSDNVRKLALLDRFMAREYYLHIRCFYDGEYTTEGLKDQLKKAREYIEDIRKLLKEHR